MCLETCERVRVSLRAETVSVIVFASYVQRSQSSRFLSKKSGLSSFVVNIPVLRRRIAEELSKFDRSGR
jgi:hypothetical protein